MSNDNMGEPSNASIDAVPQWLRAIIQLRTLDERLTKLKSIQNSGRRRYTPATHTPAPKNNNNDADAMDWVDSNVYAQARVSAVRTGF
ncbi:hypothetical protein BDBG_17251 [Blastomyces gilchristii SLH14081]|uniref:Uncharacterized protein n=1 Tax=Blastomyces gilchristii (strain SLH14081) TaxID=559298 RepID=A0A179UT70_BLAGS|nr:uncharacterized protein BDBG_17251 [Blastomyces gilchristii SLH14081]OAT09602.1 hypothetical protein BDBG_17251 [Blastomyces gilchristii SLH14081]